MEGLIEKEKGLVDTDTSVVTVGGAIRELNDNGQKIQKRLSQEKDKKS